MSTEAIVKTINELREDIKHIHQDIQEIKTTMVDVDDIMTENDYEALLEYRKEKHAGKLLSHEELKKTLGV